MHRCNHRISEAPRPECSAEMVVALALALLLAPAAQSAPAAWKQDVFAISFWVDPIVPPAEYDYRLAEVAAANFTLVVGGTAAPAPTPAWR